jgi:ribonuclease HI
MQWTGLSHLHGEQGLIVYTDGSCSAVDRIGGWAWVAVDLFDLAYSDGGSEIGTTISRMELRAACEALDALYDEFGPSTILLYSDSQYVVLGINEPSRKRNKNVDLWLWLEEARRQHDEVVFEHVHGHKGTEGNEEADRVAGEFRKAALHGSV